MVIGSHVVGLIIAISIIIPSTLYKELPYNYGYLAYHDMETVIKQVDTCVPNLTK